jgi:hypothetical protein
MEEGKTYRIVRFYQNRGRRVLHEGLTLEEAKGHCKSPETSSRTCTTQENIQHTTTHGPWFDGWEEE